ncbi:hypothetical protein [Pedobacter psychroterrae]|uniref:Uncharacterized protein n=1 Tax=Pedobacter psychroterrae TaxID=2530453 RepID=A0A4R0NRK3_9SPHI|nr:hypothetical protein [Pedobacter psychroterrae]TCD01714.1 hypothetical protein EZ437_13435 [Pedobacter psychroterrae]
MKIKHTLFTAFFIAVSATIFSCGKIKETLQRDIVVSPAEVDFDIPIVTTTNSRSSLGEIPVTMDFDSLIRSQTKDLGIENARNFKLTSVKITLDSLRDDNNFGNFENIDVRIVSSSQPDTLVAKLEANLNTKAISVNIPIVPANPELKGFLSNSSFKFVLTGKARTPTTMVLKAQATLTYSLTVGI